MYVSRQALYKEKREHQSYVPNLLLRESLSALHVTQQYTSYAIMQNDILIH